MQLRTQRFLRLLLGLATLVLVAWGLGTGIAILLRGPDAERFQVFVLFKDVQGLQEGSRVVHRGMTIGEVAALELDAQAGRVRTLLALEADAGPLVTTTTQVWIVRPRFTGIAEELSGLDTLIKESYVTLRTQQGGERLAPREELLGLEGPPDGLSADRLEEPMTGDLLAKVVLPESHGLHAGSPVRYRGLEVGEVRDVELSAQGQGVLVHFRVRRAQRHFVREDSRFWVARPILQGNLITGITVDSLGSVLQTSLVFDAPQRGESEPAADQAFFVGRESPPRDEDWSPERVAAEGNAFLPSERGSRTRPLPPNVRVRYRAVEKDLLDDDDVQAQGPGLLYRTADGDLCVLTARSACDATFLIEDHWYDRVRVDDERIRVVLEDGRVWPARRVWVHPGGMDLAVLRVQAPAETAELPPWQSYLDFSAEDAALPQDPASEPPYLLVREGRAYGVAGYSGVEDPTPRAVSFSAVPAEQRPAGR